MATRCFSPQTELRRHLISTKISATTSLPISRPLRPLAYSTACSCWSTRNHRTRRCRNLSITRRRTAPCMARPAWATACISLPRFLAKRPGSKCSRASEVMTGMLSGSVEVMFVTPPSVMGLIKDGRVRALAFTGSKPFQAFPNVPLMKDMLPGFEPIGSWGMFFAPANTPPEIIEKLNVAVRAALQSPAVVPIMQRDGYIPDNRNVAETTAYFRQEVKLMGDAVKAAGIEPN